MSVMSISKLTPCYYTIYGDDKKLPTALQLIDV